MVEEVKTEEVPEKDKFQVTMNTRVKEIVNSLDLLVSGDFYEAFNKATIEKLKTACQRAKANGRKTLRDFDTI